MATVELGRPRAVICATGHRYGLAVIRETSMFTLRSRSITHHLISMIVGIALMSFGLTPSVTTPRRNT